MSVDIEDGAGADGLAERLFGAFIDAWELLIVQAGYRYGWYASLAQHGPLTAAELSAASATGPRFTTEWARQQTAAGILEADISGPEPRFSLPPQVAAVLLGDSGTGQNTLAFAVAELHASFLPRAQRLVDAWQYDRSGYTDDDRIAMARNQALLSAANAPDIPDRLAVIPQLSHVLARRPLRIADLGCGAGLHLDAMAAAWPAAELVGYDPDKVALDLAAQRRPPPRVTLRRADARQVAEDGPFDLIVSIDSLHDIPEPAKVLAAARTALADGGVIAIAEAPYRPEFTTGADPVERIGYLSSLFNCLHHALDHNGTTALGAVVREKDLKTWGNAAKLALATIHDAGPDTSRIYLFQRP